ncbi:MAG: tetratricopeptide repeat protein [Bacteroidia bacterium]
MKRIILCISFVICAQISFAQDAQVDSLKALLKSNMSDTARLTVLGTLVELISDNEVWPKYNNRALELAEKLAENPDPEIKLKAETALARAYNNAGLWNNLNGNVSKALEFLLKSLSIRERLGNKNDISETLHNLGTLYFDFNETELAQQYLLKSLRLSEQTSDSVNAAIALNYIGMIHIKKENYDSALYYFQKSLSVFVHTGDEYSEAKTYDDIGMTFFSLKDYGAAGYFLKKAQALQEKLDDRVHLATTFNNLSKLKLTTGNLNDALKYGMKALDLAKETGFPKEISDAEEALSKIYDAMGNTALSLVHYKKFIVYRDSIQSEEAKRVTSFEHAKFDFEKQTSFLEAEREKSNALANVEIKKQKVVRNAFVIGALLLSIILLTLWSRYRLKIKTTKQLTETIENLKQTQQQLVQQEKLASLGKLTAGIAHEIKNPLNFVNNFSDLTNELIEELMSENNPVQRNELSKDIKQNLEKISYHGKRANDILESMLRHSRTGKGEKQLTDINVLCAEFIDLAYYGMVSNIPGFNCEIKKEFDKTIPQVNVISQDISRVLINLLNNAFYAVNAKSSELAVKASENKYHPQVSIITSTSDQFITIQIKDNGMGIPEKIKEKIFEPFFTTKPSGQGTGLGLSLSYDIIKAHGGEIIVDSKSGEGTEFTIRLPLK